MNKFKIIVLICVISKFCYSQNYYSEGCRIYYETGGDINKAIELFSKAIEANEEKAKAYMMRGAAKIYLSEYASAFSDLSNSLKLDSNNYKAYFYYGRGFFAQGFFNNAIKYYDIAISKNKFDAETYNSRAMAKAMNQDYLAAIEDESKAIEIDSNNAEFYDNRSFAKIQLKMYKEAIEDCNSALRKVSGSQSYANRGFALAGLGMHMEAIKDFTIALREMPKAKDLYFYRGVSFKTLNKMNEACADFSKSAELNYEPAMTEKKKTCN